ncbi:MAG: type II secretion system F family protein [Candidatus Aenigmatarchaeota archaeon]|nr:MAG: type II secretion system F family protein [Candidatus Aenigmarchaeota archaeon]
MLIELVQKLKDVLGIRQTKGKNRGYSTRFEKWAGKSSQRQILVYGSLFAGAALVTISFFFFQGSRQAFAILNLLGASIAIGPSMIIRYNEYRTLKRIESTFPQFLNDIVESTNAGQTLPQAIKSASRNEYGPLSPYVKKIAAQIDWGIPFDKILENMASSLNSKLLRRTVSTIIETHRSGGNISDVLRAVSESVTEIDRIREERKAHVYSQMITGYTIFFVFLGVIVGMQKFLIPTLLITGEGAAGIGLSGTAGLVTRYQFLFQALIVIQAIFSGFAIGKMSEGSMVAGVKHVIVLFSVGMMAIVLIL